LSRQPARGKTPPRPAIDVVCLCDVIDLKAHFQDVFRQQAPWLRLLRPDEVADPRQIRYALGWKPTAGQAARFRALRLVSSVGAGADALLECQGLARDVVISRIMDPEQAAMMSAFALWHVIGLHREMHRYPAQQQAHRWRQRSKAPPSRFPVGVLGYGHMGQHLADCLHRLGYPVHAATRRTPEQVPAWLQLASGEHACLVVAARCRVLVNLLPLTAATRGILDAQLFRVMPRDAWLVHLGRGGHLVAADLLAALDAGDIAGAALDVFPVEPLPKDDALWDHPGVRITPHVASEVDDRRVADWLAEQIDRLESGRPALGIVDRDRGY
jgi:glyoxylate/hydroxypyruvate reductase A